MGSKGSKKGYTWLKSWVHERIAEEGQIRDEAVKALAAKVQRSDYETTIVVFNPHTQPRSDLVRLPFIRVATHSTFREIETLESR